MLPVQLVKPCCNLVLHGAIFVDPVLNVRLAESSPDLQQFLAAAVGLQCLVVHANPSWCNHRSCQMQAPPLLQHFLPALEKGMAWSLQSAPNPAPCWDRCVAAKAELCDIPLGEDLQNNCAEAHFDHLNMSFCTVLDLGRDADDVLGGQQFIKLSAHSE
eukprot:CAMPEP_0178406876 /NCGR_PEP_ID=MMETSP0689_2-20121128/19136_1 /TAXON_ID=160604 /ORGANISM="Amphidinium massartii, Strain CS-259" /LENGTH=158 /DNA_ID=CAMNT_0020027927 /DNA_START=268 /DNA_END=744 /DNA_ORIENTATION=-